MSKAVTVTVPVALRLAALSFSLSLSLSVCVVAAALGRPVNSRYQQIVDSVNSADTTWTAGVNERFAYEDSSLDNAKKLMGAWKTALGQGPAADDVLDLPVTVSPAEIVQTLPDEYDARTQWGSLCPSVNEIRDQSECGSCWAFAVVEAASDRICMATNGTVNVHFSARDLISCCIGKGKNSCGEGCDGGIPYYAWKYLKDVGLVSGGNYGDHSLCSMYPFPLCDHHIPGKYGPCPSHVYPTPKCVLACDTNSTYNVTYKADKHKFHELVYLTSKSVAQIQSEIISYGPVESGFYVYEDFLTYKSGVYQKTAHHGKNLGAHSIKILGWGVDNGTAYWTAANSWNEDWGNNGYFNILRGKNECDIEAEISAGRYHK